MTRAFAILAAVLLSMGLALHGAGALAQTSQPMTSGADMVPFGVDAQTQQRWLAFQQQETQQFQSLLRQLTARPVPLPQDTQSLEGPRQQQDQIVKPSPRQLQARAQLDALFKQGFGTEAERQQAAQLFEQGHWTLKTFARGTQLQAAEQKLPLVQRQIKARQDQIPPLEKTRDQQKAELRAQKERTLKQVMQIVEQQKKQDGSLPNALLAVINDVSRTLNIPYASGASKARGAGPVGANPGSSPVDSAQAVFSDIAAMFDQREQQIDRQFAQLINQAKGEIEELQRQAAILQQQIRTLQAG